MRLEAMKKIESDMGVFIGRAKTMEERMAKIERLWSVIDIIQSDTKTTQEKEKSPLKLWHIKNLAVCRSLNPQLHPWHIL